MEVVNDDVILQMVDELHIKREQIISVLDMLKDDKTVAFIARYRKEATGGLDEDAIRSIEERYSYGVSLEKRKADVRRLIDYREPLRIADHAGLSAGPAGGRNTEYPRYFRALGRTSLCDEAWNRSYSVP